MNLKKSVTKILKYKNEYGKLIKNSSIMRIIIAGMISDFGSKVSYFALLRKVYVLSAGRVTDLGFLSIMQSVPYIIFGAAAGIIIDRLPRKWIMIVSDIISAFVTMSVIFVNNLNLIYAVSFTASFVYVFRNPAQGAFEPNLVEREDIPLLNSYESSVNSISQIIGSALGAAVVGIVGITGAFLIDGASFFISAAIISTLFVPEKHIEETKQKTKGYLREFTGGVSIMWENGSLKLMLLIDLYVTFAMAMQGPLIYYFIKQTLKMGDRAELAWGILLSSLGVGAILGSLAIGILVKKYRNKFKLLLNVLIFDSVFFTAFLINVYFPVSVVIFTFLGCIGTAHMIILNTVIQETVSDENRGKVFSAFAMLRSPVSILSILIGTTAAAVFTAKTVLLVVAALEAVIALGVRITPTYRQFERTIHPEIQASE